MYSVYKHTCPNGKVYIGITVQTPLRRWRNGFGYVDNEHFTRAIKKYGWDNIKHDVLFVNLTKAEAEQKEIELIAKHKSTNPQYGYNKDNGGNSIGKVSEETKRKLSVLLSGENHPCYGKHFNEERRAHISASLKGEKNPRFGKRFNRQGVEHKRIKQGEETKKRKSIAHKGQIPINRIAVKQYDNNGSMIAEYNSYLEASIATGVAVANICRSCNGKRKTAGGFVWIKTAWTDG